MNTHRSNASVVAVLVILLVIAGVIYLFWQNQKALPETPAAEETSAVEESAPVDESAPAADEAATVETSAEAN